MILINIAIAIFIVGVVFCGISLVTKNRKIKILGILILLFLLISIILFLFYALYENDQELINQGIDNTSEYFTDSMNNANNTSLINDVNIINNSNSDNNMLSVEYSGKVLNINNSTIECGPIETLSTNLIFIDEETKITNYLTNNEMKLSDIKQGDCINVVGDKVTSNNDLEQISAKTILVYQKDEIKKEAGKYINDTYRIDDSSIAYSNVDLSGNGYIICEINVDNFSYPIKLNVNKNTETFLGYSMHLQSNYGYVLHEMCWITLDTKVEDIDNIKGYVKMIEYIAD